MRAACVDETEGYLRIPLHLRPSLELALRSAGIPPVRSPYSDPAVPAVNEEFGPIAPRLRSAGVDRGRLRAVSRAGLLVALLLYGLLVALRRDMDVALVRHHFTSLSLPGSCLPPTALRQTPQPSVLR